MLAEVYTLLSAVLVVSIILSALVDGERRVLNAGVLSFTQWVTVVRRRSGDGARVAGRGRRRSDAAALHDQRRDDALRRPTLPHHALRLHWRGWRRGMHRCSSRFMRRLPVM